MFHRHTMRAFPSLRSLLLALIPRTRWLSVTQQAENTCQSACCTEETLLPRMSTPPLQQSRPRRRLNLLTGVQLASRYNKKLSWTKSRGFTVSLFLNSCLGWYQLPATHCCPWWWPCQTAACRLLPGPVLTTSLTWCMPRGLSSTGKSRGKFVVLKPMINDL